tara:strand:+ start:215 stop:487 length:273 start_codon:yes stop_codon:yes gene_type:complete
MSYQDLSNYLIGIFFGGLGFFNSWKLEARQLTDSNNELIWQNGMIISATLVFVCLAGFIGEWINIWMGPYRLKKMRPTQLTKKSNKVEEE